MTEPYVGDPRIGKTLQGKYHVIRELGRGGMGVVYEVEHVLTRHRRALKILHSAAAASASALERFRREATVPGRLKIPQVVETLDAGQLEDGAPYVLMELVEGGTLRDALRQAGVLSPARAARLVAQACEGLAVAHAHGIIHRDLKPENLLVQTDDRTGEEKVRLLDFGVSKFVRESLSRHATADRAVLGTPEYMSPEQIQESKSVDERTDVYALGAVLYELVCGRLPFEASTYFDLSNRIVGGRHQRAAERTVGLDGELDAIIERALHRDRDRRFASARELGFALRSFSSRGVNEAPLRSVSGGAALGAASESGAEVPTLPPPTGPAATRSRPAATSTALGQDSVKDSSLGIARPSRLGMGLGGLAAGGTLILAWQLLDTPRASVHGSPIAEPRETSSLGVSASRAPSLERSSLTPATASTAIRPVASGSTPTEAASSRLDVVDRGSIVNPARAEGLPARRDHRSEPPLTTSSPMEASPRSTTPAATATSSAAKAGLYTKNPYE